MAKPKQTVSVDDLVKQALLKIANAVSPLKLVAKDSGVFSSAAGANKDAIALLTAESLPLIVLSGEGKERTATLSPTGFERIADSISSEKIGPIVVGIASSIPPSKCIAFLQEIIRKSPHAAADLVPTLEATMAAEKAEAEERAKEAAKQRAADAATLEALERWKEILGDRKKRRIAALKRELEAEGSAAEERIESDEKSTKNTQRSSNGDLSPTSAEEVGFRRNIARRLVSSWVIAWDSNKPDAREFLESAIWNISGFRVLGEVGQRVAFDGQYHEGGSGIFTKDLVKIVRPGWLLEELDDREYVVLKAQVAKN